MEVKSKGGYELAEEEREKRKRKRKRSVNNDRVVVGASS
jgi:hypothetical protein